MNKELNSWLSIITIAIVGVLFTLWADEASLFSWLVRALGMCLILPGIYVFIQSFGKQALTPTAEQRHAVPNEIDFTMPENGKKEQVKASISVPLLVASICTVLLGLWLLVTPDFFVALFAILIAGLLVVYGFYQLAILFYTLRTVKVPWQFFVVPGLFLIAGIVILSTPVRSMNYIVSLTTGVLLIMSAINSAVQRILSQRNG